MFGFIFLSLNFYYISLITHNSSLNFSHLFGIITQFSLLNIIHTICGPMPVTRCSFFFWFLFSVTKLTLAKKKKKENQPRKKKKKLKVVKSYGWYCLRIPHVCLITKMPLSYELWKQSYRLPNNLFAMGLTI